MCFDLNFGYSLETGYISKAKKVPHSILLRWAQGREYFKQGKDYPASLYASGRTEGGRVWLPGALPGDSNSIRYHIRPHLVGLGANLYKTGVGLSV